MRKVLVLSMLLGALGAGMVPACLGNDDFGGDGDADTDSDTDSDTNTAQDCELLTSEPCAAEQNCVLDGFFETGCIPAGAGGQGEPCANSADCARTYHCMPPSNVCSRWCTAASAECPEGSLCTLVVLDEEDVEVGRVCKTTTACDVLTQEGCPDGQSCWIVRPSDGVTDCGGVNQAGVQGDACQFLSDCAAGFQCDDGTCRAYCLEGGGEPSCGVGFTCRGQGFDTINGQPVGYCE